MNTTLSTDLPSQGTPQRADKSTDLVGTLRALSERELLDLAERHDIAGDQLGLHAVRAEAERRAHHEASESLVAQVAGYLSLLAEDTEHALADEADAWGLELHRILDAAAAVPAPRPHADRAVRS